MRKLTLVLVMLLVAPAMAAVDINAVQVGDTNVVVITYEADGNLPRAFALDITATGGNS